MRHNFNKTSFLLIIPLFLWSCAAYAPPPGGPVDTTSPELLSVTPTSGTVNLTEREIHLTFSEYMDEKSFANGINISPVLENEIAIDFMGEDVLVVLPQELPQNKTIVVTLSRHIKDEHGVELAIPIQIAYSTGDSIDSGEISGNIFTDGSAAVYLWQLESNHYPDSLLLTLPNYITETSDEGNFSFNFLAKGFYQILALDRSASGYELDPLRMAYGVHSTSFIPLDSVVSNVRIQMHKTDEPLRLLSGEWAEKFWGQLNFNKPLDMEHLSLITPRIDSLPLKFFPHPTDPKAILLLTENHVPVEKGKREIFVKKLTQTKDTLDSLSISVMVSAEEDTNYLNVINQDKIASITPNNEGPPLKLIFTKPLKENLIDSLKMSLTMDDSLEIPFNISVISPMEIYLNPEDGWVANKRYSLELLAFETAIKWNSFADSLRIITINTTKPQGYGGLMGTVSDVKAEKLIVKIKPVESEGKSFQSIVNSARYFEFTHIPEGHYTLIFYEDRDGNQDYSFGTAFPFLPSEWFNALQDTMEIRSNWDIELSPIMMEK